MNLTVVIIIIVGVAVAVLSLFIVRIVSLPRQSRAMEEALKQGRTAVVIRSAKAIIAKSPHNPVPRWFLGLAYQSEGKNELALMEFKAINQLGHFGPELPEPAFRAKIAELYLRFGQEEEALKEYILLSKLEPRKAAHFLSAGRLFESRGRTDVAVNYLRKAIEIDERVHEAHHILGLILYRTKHPMEAKAELEAAIKWNPDDFEAHYYIGKILKEMSDYATALAYFEKASRGGELRLKALVERGGCFMSQGSLDKAISELERAARIIKDESATEALYGRYFLAMCYEKSRNVDRAIEQWEKIYSRKPNFRDVAEKLTQYQEYRTDDRMKDFLTFGKEDFAEICKSVVQSSMSLSIRDVAEIPNGFDIIAVENESDKWVATKKLPRLLRFLRVSENLDEDTVRLLLEQMKKLGVVRGGIVTSSGFTRGAFEFAENRSVELYSKDKLQDLLNRADFAKIASRR